MKLQVNCTGSESLPWKDFVDIQQKAKTMDGKQIEKLINAIEKHGFAEPFGIWHNPETNQNIILSGNQRRKAIERMAEIGWEIPEKLPCHKIKAGNLKEATQMLLSLASTFGRVDMNEVEALAKSVDLSLDELSKMSSFVEIDLEKIKQEVTEEISEIQKSESKAIEDINYIEFIKIPYPKDEFNEVFTMFECYKNAGDFSDYPEAFRQLLKDGMEKINNENP